MNLRYAIGYILQGSGLGLIMGHWGKFSWAAVAFTWVLGIVLITNLGGKLWERGRQWWLKFLQLLIREAQ